MVELKKDVKVWLVTESSREQIGDAVAVEHTFNLFVNGEKVVSLYCSPTDLEELALGFLESEGILTSLDDVIRLEVRNGDAWVEMKRIPEVRSYTITSSGGRTSHRDIKGLQGLGFEVKLSPSELIEAAAFFENASETWKLTHGVHSAALFGEGKLLVFKEDLGRHNAVDKVFGWCLLQRVIPEGKILFLSGRISSEMVFKAAMRRVPVVISLASPTDRALQLAERVGITVIGSARGGKIKVFTCPERIL